MKRHRLTEKMIRTMDYSGDGRKPSILWDSECHGLGVRAYPSGAKTYVLDYRVRGRRRRMSLGHFGQPLSLEEARQEARQLLYRVVKGHDPLAEREKVQQGTGLSDLLDRWYEAVAHGYRAAAQYRRRLKRIRAAWGNPPAAGVTTADVRRLHAVSAQDAPAEADAMLATVRQACRWADKMGLLDHDPTKGVERSSAPGRRSRYLSPDELGQLTAAVAAHPNPYTRAAVWLLLYTGMRKTELVLRKWSDVDWEWRTLRVPKTKTGVPALIPLPAVAVEILTELPRTGEYLFPGRSGKAPMTNLGQHWEAIRTAAGLPDVTLHDLRRTVGAWIVQDTGSTRLAADVLRHADPSVTSRHYAWLSGDAVRDALEHHAAAIDKARRSKT